MNEGHIITINVINLQTWSYKKGQCIWPSSPSHPFWNIAQSSILKIPTWWQKNKCYQRVIVEFDLIHGLSVYRYVCLSVCLPVCQSVCLSVCLPVCLSVCLSVSLSLCQSVCQSVCLSSVHRDENHICSIWECPISFLLTPIAGNFLFPLASISMLWPSNSSPAPSATTITACPAKLEIWKSDK